MEKHRQRYDLILRNGTVIDGAGRSGFVADVAVKGERIAHVGDLGHAAAHIEIDVLGCTVAPGFIDVHTHDDSALIAHPLMTAKLSQGVTTVIGGNCGISAAPCAPQGDLADFMKVIFKSTRHLAAGFAEYLDKVVAACPAVNAAFLTGHSTLRMQAMGEDLDRISSEAEMAQMRDSLTDCMAEGSLGLSTGLYYPPARAATTREVIEVARTLKDFNGVYVTHLRDESDGVLDSVQEALQIGRAIETPVILSHHKCVGTGNFGRSVETLALIDQAGKSQPVSLDAYPYAASSTMLNKDRADKSSRVLITWSGSCPQMSGRELGEAAQELGCSRDEAIERLLPAGAIYFAMDEADVTRILRFPRTMIGSDGLPDDEHPHPRLWGTFPRVLSRYVRERKELTLEDAVHRMTGLAASRFGFENRGRIEIGYYADLTVFDPDRILDTATYEHPRSAATGICYVFVNGVMAWNAGMHTGSRSGKVLRREDLRDRPVTRPPG